MWLFLAFIWLLPTGCDGPFFESRHWWWWYHWQLWIRRQHFWLLGRNWAKVKFINWYEVFETDFWFWYHQYSIKGEISACDSLGATFTFTLVKLSRILMELSLSKKIHLYFVALPPRTSYIKIWTPMLDTRILPKHSLRHHIGSCNHYSGAHLGWGQGRGYEPWSRTVYVMLDLFNGFLG